ncbi:MAG: AmmeMemoRadiSam system protein A [Firmicutes bacterium]|nr:AmmeMemoRadiSam system protein A [Bacillota bacterium]
MGKIVGAYILPHPPIMIEEIGGRESNIVSNTINSLRKVSKRINEQEPDTIIIVTPHGPMFNDAMNFAMEDKLTGDFRRFGASTLKYEFENDIELAEKIIDEADKENVYCIPFTKDMAKTYGTGHELDHGALVPLHFIEKDNKDFKLVHITYSGLSDEDHYKLGIGIKKAAKALDREVVVIASGDLSHRLTIDAPAGYDKRGKEYDKFFLEVLEKGEVLTFLNIEKEFIAVAGECAYKSVVVLLGCFDNCHIKGELYSYEGPFGVGYGVMEFSWENCNGGKSIFDEYRKTKKSYIKNLREKEDPYVRLARLTLENKIKYNKAIKIPDDLPEEMLGKRAGVFVTLKKNDNLRGCIGTINPTTKSIADEIMRNAVSAGLDDPRFSPVEEYELDDLIYSVDVLGEAEEIDSKGELDPKRYGVIVRKGVRTGLLLPNLEGVETAEEQLSIALRKAGISEKENYKIERFEVIRHN